MADRRFETVDEVLAFAGDCARALRYETAGHLAAGKPDLALQTRAAMLALEQLVAVVTERRDDISRREGAASPEA